MKRHRATKWEGRMGRRAAGEEGDGMISLKRSFDAPTLLEFYVFGCLQSHMEVYIMMSQHLKILTWFSV